MLLGSGVTVEFWETAATYRLKDAHLGPSRLAGGGQGYRPASHSQGEDAAVFTLVFFLLHGEWLRGCRSSLRAAQIAHLDHHCGNVLLTLLVHLHHGVRPGYPCLSTVLEHSTFGGTVLERKKEIMVPLGR